MVDELSIAHIWCYGIFLMYHNVLRINEGFKNINEIIL